MSKKLSSRKTKVFVSYCYNDVNADRPRLEYLKQRLDSLSNGVYEVHIDFSDTEPGTNINDYMREMASQADVAIILMGPEYKKRVQDRQGGVFEEFNILYLRHLEARDGNIDEQQISLIPILFCGSPENSVVDGINDLIYEDFTKLYVAKLEGEVRVAKSTEQFFSTIFDKISATIRHIHYINQRKFKRQQALYFRRLFIDTKSDWDQAANHENIERLFVKTKVYQWVSNGEVSFIIGRKGSGKSTITHVLPVLEGERFNLKIPIDINEFFLETYYNLFVNRGSLSSDVRDIYRKIDAFRFVWDCFFHLAYIYTVVTSENGRWEPTTYDVLKDFISSVLDWDETAHIDDLKNPKDFNALYSYVFGKLPDFVDNCISTAKPENFGAALVTSFHIDKFRTFVFGNNVWEKVYQTIVKRKRKIVLTFDGFDTILELFRSESAKRKLKDLDDRINFEISWLHSLILLILDKGLKKESRQNKLYEVLHYCIAIPYDRFLEVKSLDRDAYRLNNRFTSIRWSGIELSALLRKRLYELNPISEDKSLSLEDRLTQLIKKGIPGLPTDISIEFNNKTYSIPLFLYVLRHTFWRPRDVLTYYANLLSAKDSLSMKGSIMNAAVVKEVIASTTRSVLDAEFFKEFDGVLNLEGIVAQFQRSKQIISWDEVSEKLKDFDFRLQSNSVEELSTDDKIEFLYEIGFLGIIVPEENKDSHHKYAFIFNEDRFLQEKLGRSYYKELEYVVHPIFCEYLQLDTNNNAELTLMFTWDYLHKNETIRHLRPLL